MYLKFFTSEQFTDDEQFKLMISKGVYPYEYIDNYNRLYETQLPETKFYSSCDDEDYKRAVTVWNTFL